MITRRRALQGITAGVMAAGLAWGITGCGSSAGAPKAESGPKVLTLASGVEPPSFDPAQSREAQFVQYFQPVFDTLIRRDPSGKPVPMLAESWSYNQDNTVLTFRLRSGVKFTDGSAFDAAAAKANLDRFKTAGGPLQSQLAFVASTAAPDATTLTVTLTTPDPSLIYSLGGPSGYMQSPAQFNNPDIKTQPVGTGPYKLDRPNTTPGAQYTFVKNEDYWNKDLQKFASIVIKPIKDENARLNALQSGQADGMIATPKTVKQAESAKLSVLKVAGDWQGLSLFDRAGTITPELKDVRVRQAINYAIDKKTILDKIGLGLGDVTSQIFSPASSAYVKDLDNAYPYDVDKAKSLLADTGLSGGFTLKMPTSSDMDPAMAPAIKEQLGRVGITVDWVDVPQAQYQAEQQSGKYAAAFAPFGQAVIPWTNVTQIVTPKAAWNVTKFEDPQVNSLLATIAKESADSAGSDLQSLNKYLVDQAWFAPFYRIQQPYYTGSKVKVQVQPGQAVPSIYNYEPAGS